MTILFFAQGQKGMKGDMGEAGDPGSQGLPGKMVRSYTYSRSSVLVSGYHRVTICALWFDYV